MHFTLSHMSHFNSDGIDHISVTRKGLKHICTLNSSASTDTLNILKFCSRHTHWRLCILETSITLLIKKSTECSRISWRSYKIRPTSHSFFLRGKRRKMSKYVFDTLIGNSIRLSYRVKYCRCISCK